MIRRYYNMTLYGGKDVRDFISNYLINDLHSINYEWVDIRLTICGEYKRTKYKLYRYSTIEDICKIVDYMIVDIKNCDLVELELNYLLSIKI